MQRDMELIRKILITIEKNYIDVALDYSKVNIRFLYKGIIINHNKNRANLH